MASTFKKITLDIEICEQLGWLSDGVPENSMLRRDSGYFIEVPMQIAKEYFEHLAKKKGNLACLVEDSCYLVADCECVNRV